MSMHESPIKRRLTRKIRVGNVFVGGDAPITVQTMTNTETCDVDATVAQIQRCVNAGADIVRVSVPTMDAAKAFFASAWADQCEDSDNAGMLSGREIFNIMPDEIDPAATHAAKTLRMGIEASNAQTIDVLMQYIERNANGDRDATIE